MAANGASASGRWRNVGNRLKTLISVAVTEEELGLIDEQASSAGLNRTAYLVQVGTEGGAGRNLRIRRELTRLQRQAQDLAEGIDAVITRLED